ncbi:MAG: plastocyanin/azurin family copper-binding protein [Gaiellaceae bacterium]
MKLTLTLITASLLAVLVLIPANAASTVTRIKGEVGPGFTIEVEKAGKDVKTLKAGKYSIKVEDKATTHNFHLIGPGLNKKTGVPFKGETTWMITLKPGRYTYQCDPHAASGMKGSFRVTR